MDRAPKHLDRPARAVPRLALTPREAAESLGIGLTTLKEHVQPHLRIVRCGRVRMIPVAELQRWVNENAERVLEDAS